MNISYTTRAPRSGEKEGLDYFFISQNQFDTMRAQGEFLETIDFVGASYGSSKTWVKNHLARGISVVLVIDVRGGAAVKKQLPVTTIFLKPPSLTVLKNRLRGRGTETDESIQKKLQRAEEEIKESASYDYIIINDDLEVAAQQLETILLASHPINL
jgi:guanylate kinase